MDKPLLIRRDVFDLVRDIHVQVNSARRAIGRVAATDVQEQPHGKGRVLLIRKVMVISAFNIADVSLRPVALFANGLRRPRVCGTSRESAARSHSALRDKAA